MRKQFENEAKDFNGGKSKTGCDTGLDAKDKIQKAKDSLEITRNAYLSDESTKVGYLELQNARKNYNMAKLEYISRLKFYNNSLANLQKNIFMYDVNSVL